MLAMICLWFFFMTVINAQPFNWKGVVQSSITVGSAVAVDFYQPSSNPNLWQIQCAFSGLTDQGIYVGPLQNAGLQPYRVFSPYQTYFKPAIRQQPPINTKSLVYVAWVTAGTNKLLMGTYNPFNPPSYAYDAYNLTGGSEVWVPTPDSNFTGINFYFYFMSSINLEIYTSNNNWLVFSMFGISTSSTSPPTSGPYWPCLVFSKDSGKTLTGTICVPETSGIYDSNNVNGPSIAIYNSLIYMVFSAASNPNVLYLVSCNGQSFGNVVQIGNSSPFALMDNPFITKTGVSDMPFMVLYVAQPGTQYAVYYNASTFTWVSAGQAYSTPVVTNSVSVRYEPTFLFGYGLFQGPSNTLYYDVFQITQ